MPLPFKASKPAAAKKSAAKPKEKKQRASRFAEVKASVARSEYLEEGVYRVQFANIEEGHNPGKHTDSAKVDLLVVEVGDGDSQVGETCFLSFALTGDSAIYQIPRFKAMAISGIGLGPTLADTEKSSAREIREARAEAEAAYDQWEIEELSGAGSFLDAQLGVDNGVEDALEGRYVDVIVRRGKDDGKGGYYRDYDWFAVPEEDQP